MVRTETLRRAFAHALAFAPGLGALACAVAVLGVREAVRVCGTRKPPPKLQAKWDELGYYLAQLPSKKNVRLLLVGIEAQHAMYAARRNDPSTPFSVVVKALGHSQRDILLGMRLVRAYSIPADITYEELGAI